MSDYQKYKRNNLCPGCGKDAATGFVQCSSCREKGKLSLRNRAAFRKANGLCLFCGTINDNSPKVRCLDCTERNKVYSAKGIKRTPEQSKAARERLKREVFNAYGGVFCRCCGTTEMCFLTLDHTNNDGNQHRKELKARGIYHIYSYLKKMGFPKGFQVLCFNCNCGKNVNGGVCPHKEAGEKQWQSISSAPQTIDSTLQKLLESNLREQSTYLRYASSVA